MKHNKVIHMLKENNISAHTIWPSSESDHGLSINYFNITLKFSYPIEYPLQKQHHIPQAPG